MKHIYILLLFGYLGGVWKGQAQTPSTDQNYTQTQTYREAGGKQPVTTIEYLDGLGRPVQTVAHQASPTQKDIVTRHSTYNAAGQPDQTYLPTPTAGNTGAFVPNIASPATSFYQDPVPFTQTFYEASPLSRVVEQYGAGDAWRTARRSVKTSYQTNTTAEVRLWTANSQTAISNGFYTAGELYKTIVTDEENHLLVEYKDKMGRLLQKNVQDGGTQSNPTWLTTCYVYDAMNRLAYVIPPQLYANKVQTASGSVTLSESTDAEFIFAYHYGERNRLVEKLVPGAGWTRFVYNPHDRLILSQNARQAAESKWTFSKYDGFGRLIMGGEVVQAGKTHTQLQAEANAATTHTEQRTTGGLLDYTNLAYPLSRGKHSLLL